MNQHAKVGVVIASFRRPHELEKVLDSLTLSSQPIETIAVVDASPEAIKPAIETVISRSSLKNKIQLLHSDLASLCHQRNLGIAEMRKQNINFVQILDDDTSPSPTYIKTLFDFLAAHPDAVGISGFTSDQIDTPSKGNRFGKFIYWLAGLEGYRPGSISRAGCGIPADIKGMEYQEVQWIFGCSMWSMRVFETLEYLDDLPGSGLFEDVYFSLKASRLGSLYVARDARLEHSLSEVGRPDLALYSYRFSRNRWFVAQAHPRKLQTAFWYVVSVAFLAAVNSFNSLLTRETSQRLGYRRASAATVTGLIDAFASRKPR